MVLNETQRMVRESARQFAREQVAPYARDWERAGAFPAATLAAMGELGFLGMTVPETLGGAGLDYVS